MTVDHAVLTGQEYADGSRLSARIAIYAWQRPRVDLVQLALDRLGEVDGPVLDVGWGAGGYTGALRAARPEVWVIPVDLAAGLAPEVVGEVDRLPFADGRAGATLAMHMLYYATDVRAAVRELRRVLRPGGRFLASTNGRADKPEWADLRAAALRDLGVADPPPYPKVDERFTLEDGAELVREVFGACTVVERRSELVVPDAEPVLAYLHSTRGHHARALPTGLTWADYLSAAERRIRADIDRTGAFRLTAHTGILLAAA
ncbi:class I SAM-dependent methyltransferase [Actinopolymorpha pittospori]|uniref:SAM-dependent methyltransferase n=1 Tax=Actinopolymorpha pittospori TaxID=648752 RepID=A0A927N4J6_9ACTN|nr:class I SAM-dependent methyltransferase [Actinopolymorpha pittospori]MBE1610853.1 SAM-dependent methyltransferase [Actinopolymorpha pittospori]